MKRYVRDSPGLKVPRARCDMDPTVPLWTVAADFPLVTSSTPSVSLVESLPPPCPGASRSPYFVRLNEAGARFRLLIVTVVLRLSPGAMFLTSSSAEFCRELAGPLVVGDAPALPMDGAAGVAANATVADRHPPSTTVTMAIRLER